MKKLIFIVVTVFLLSGCSKVGQLPTKQVILNGYGLTAEVAQTPVERQQGLSGRKSLCATCGMLFLFETTAQYTFWMKYMNFPLDLVWLKDGVIEEITYNLPQPLAGQDPMRVIPQEPINGVLEINAGQATAWGLEIGQKIEGI